MPSRREFVKNAAYASLVGVTLAETSCTSASEYGPRLLALRSPLDLSAQGGALLRELVRCATLAANGHNTQPWKFSLSSASIGIYPDHARSTPIVDPDDHHQWISLGCAVENLVIAAAALGRHPDVLFSQGGVRVSLDTTQQVSSPLAKAIFLRQSTRAEYDGQPLPNDILQQLGRAAQRDGVRTILTTDHARIESVLDYVTRGNSAQLQNPAFVKELKHWIRFNQQDALASGDGLFSAASGSPTLPGWLGNLVFPLVLSEKSDNDKYARQVRSSAGVAIFVGERADPASWFEVGRAYQRFALTATSLDVCTALINQPVEVSSLRAEFAQSLGLGPVRPDLVVRFGRGPRLPYAMRRPVADVIL